MPGLLAGKRILVTGVTTHRSIAFAVAREAESEEAEIALTTFGPRRPMTERAARRLGGSPAVLDLDIRSEQDALAVAEELDRRWGGLDGVVHAIAFSPADVAESAFTAAPTPAILETLETSAVSLNVLARTLRPLLARTAAGSIVGIDFDASVAWPGYGWMGVAKAGLESICRYLAHELGAQGTRVNLVSAGPLNTPAALGVKDFAEVAAAWPQRAPLGWDADDASGVADAACFLLSDRSRQISGEILHVDGGRHAVGIP